MPDLYAQVPDGTYLQFPANTKPEVMQRAVKNYLTAARSKQAPKPAAPPQLSRNQQDIQNLQQNMGIPGVQLANRAHPNAPGPTQAVTTAHQHHEQATNEAATQAAGELAAKQQAADIDQYRRGDSGYTTPVHDPALEQKVQAGDKGSMLNRIVPNWDWVLANNQGIHGSLQRAASGVVESAPLLLTGLAGPEIAANVGTVFTVQMAKGFMDQMQDMEKYKNDRRGYFADLLLSGGLMAVPHAAPKIWAKLTAGAEAAGVPQADIIAADKRIGPMRKVGPGIEGKEAKRIGPGTGFTAHKEGISTGTEPPARSRKPAQAIIPDRQFKGTDTTRRPAPGVAPDPKRTVLPEPAKSPKPVRRPAPGVLPKPPARITAEPETPKPVAKVDEAPPPPAAKARTKGTRTGSRTAGQLQFGVRPGSPEAKAIDKFREFNDWRKSMGYGMKPVLGRISHDAQREVTNHESSKTIAAIQSHYRIPEVTKILDEGQSRKTPTDLKGRFLTYGVADRAIAERNRVTAELTKNQVDYTTQVRAVKDARNAVIRAQNAVKLSKGGFKEVQDARRVLTKALDEANKTKGTIKEQTDQLSKIAVQRAKNPLLDPISGKPITEASVKSFMADPIVKRAVAAHNKHVQPILDANQSAQGGVLTGVRGQYSGMYVPADALDEAGGPAHLGSAAGGANSAGLRAPLAQLGANTSDKHFTGTAHSYSGDYEEVIRERFRSGYDRATERKMHQTLINKNIERPLTIQTEKKDAAGNVILDKAGNPVMQNVKNPTIRTNPDHPSQLEMNTGTKTVPRWEPAEIVKLQDRVQGGLKYSRMRAGKGLGTVDPTIHTEVAIPTRVWKEMRPIFETAHKSGIDRLADTAFSSFMEKYLTGFAEVNAHMLAQASNVTHAKRFMQGFGGKSAIPSMLQTPIEFIRNFNPKSYDAATKRIAITKAAKAGIVPPDWPYQYRDIASSTSKGKDIAWNVAHASRHKLYGEDGIITNAAASIYTEWKALGYDKSPNGEKMLYDAYRFLNTFGATDDAGLQKIFRSVGGGTFYRTGIKNQTAALKAGKMVFAAGLAANVVTWTAGFMAVDEKHRKPWEVPGAKLFDIPLPGVKSKDGGQVYINTQFLDRSMMNYGAKRVGADTLMHAVADKMHWTNAALQLGADEINVRSPLATSGPLPAGIESATTLSPFAVPNEKLTGLKTIPGASADYRLTDIRRWLNLIQAELPVSQTGMSMQGDRGASKIANTSAQVLNSVIKTLGMGQLHVAEPENKVLQRVRAAEQANARVGQPKRERAPAMSAPLKQIIRETKREMK